MELIDVIIGELPSGQDAFASADKSAMAVTMQINLRYAINAAIGHFPAVDCSKDVTILVPKFMREIADIAFIVSGERAPMNIGPAFVRAIGEAEDHGDTRYLIKIHDKFFQINPSDKNV